MTSSKPNNDLVTSQQKLEWVAPKISLMEAEDTAGKEAPYLIEIKTGILTLAPS